MWKLFWSGYLIWFIYVVITQDYVTDKSNSLFLAGYGGTLAFIVVFSYLMDLKSWLDQVKEDKETLRDLYWQVHEMNHEIVEMKLRLEWIIIEPDA
jgi:hypothetical protein